MKKETFFSRNAVAIVMIPCLIGMHYGWTLMQKNRVLVSENEEIDLPAVTFAKYCWQKVQQFTGTETQRAVTADADTKATTAAK